MIDDANSIADQIKTEIEINNRIYSFRVDTGSQDNFISEDLAKDFMKSIHDSTTI